MRIRSVFAFVTGAAVGAVGMYLNDPDLGEGRRREVRRDAFARVRSGAAGAAKTAARQAKDVARSAVEGYQDAAEVDPR